MWKKFSEIHGNSFLASHFSRHEYPAAAGFLCSSRSVGTAQGLEKRMPLKNFSQQNASSFAIIPIPLHFKKQYERGFNQAELLSKEFSRLSNIPLLANTLLKIKETPAQVETPNKELRIKNLEKAFQINPKISKSDLMLLTSGALILIDDVATTGSTLFHAASALRIAGAKKIIGLVVAHGA